MKNSLIIKIKNNALIFHGSIEAVHHLNEDAAYVIIKLSDGTNVHFDFNEKKKAWVIRHNKKASDSPKYYKLEPNNVEGSNEEIIFNYNISNALVSIDGHGLRRYGIPDLSKEQIETYNTLIKYLTDKGVICVEGIKNDLKLILTGTYKGKDGQNT